jgi:hypothetical protein
MKQKFMRLFTGIAIVTTICIGFSSFVGDGEDDGVQKKKETLNVCFYTCWYQDSQGNWYFSNVVGTNIDCPKVTYPSECTPTGCQPLNPC